MAHPESAGVAGLRIETSFRQPSPRWAKDDMGRESTISGDGIESDRTNTSHGYNAHSRDTNRDHSVLNDLHSATPPISVPRPDSRPTVNDDDEFPHKPDDIQGSPLDSYLQSRRTSISFNPRVSLDSGLDQPLGEPLARNETKNRPPQKHESRTSGLRNALSQDDAHTDQSSHSWEWGTNPGQDQRGMPTGASRRAQFSMSPGNESTGAELDHPTSLTSLSTASPVQEEVRTPPGSVKDDLLSPLYITSPTQPFASPEGSWTGVMTPFGSKSRSSTLDRSSSLRNPTRHGSRRSTNSSGKSPASMFLSMWSNQGQSEEPPVAQPDDEGQQVGTDYVLGKQIGFGGFSTVKEAYKVEGQGQTKSVAVKIVKKQLVGRTERENEDVQAEFDHEVRVWRWLNHPHILTLDAVYETDYATFCFTKLAIGGTLFDLVRQNRQGLDPELAKKYTYQLACAIRYLHEDAHVVHRDIKLENCLLDPIKNPDGSTSSTLVLCDFGMAEWMTTDNGADSPDPYDEVADRPPPSKIGPAGSSTSVAGSLEYASPELLQSSNGVIHPSVDIWALGVIVFTVVVGSRPFQDSFAPRIQANIITGKWNEDAVLGDVADELLRKDRQDALDLVKGCLEMDPNKRWTIRDVLECSWLREVAISDSSSESLWSL